MSVLQEKKNNIENICKTEKCSACGVCINVCPNNAISYKKNEYGFIYPHIDNDLCADCGLCLKKCHTANTINFEYPKKAFAVWSKDEEDRKTSTSGGAASVFYQRIIKNNGVCYGAAFDSNLNVVIEGCDDDQIYKFKNSKYVHSDMKSCFKEIRKHLSDGRQVIFIGLPCQVAAIRMYLGKDYENLILVDIICHGSPPQTYLTSHIEYLENKHHKTAENVRFRDDNECYFTLNEKGRSKPFVHIHKDLDTYLLAFCNSLTYYKSCYSCKYARNERVSDITIGDFWGLGTDTPFDHPYSGAISLVLTNSEKGLDFFNSVRPMCFCEERSVEEAIKGNAQLNSPSVADNSREKFLDSYVKLGFEKSIEGIYGEEMKKQKPKIRRYELKNKIRRLAKKALGR